MSPSETPTTWPARLSALALHWQKRKIIDSVKQLINFIKLVFLYSKYGCASSRILIRNQFFQWGTLHLSCLLNEVKCSCSCTNWMVELALR